LPACLTDLIFNFFAAKADSFAEPSINFDVEDSDLQLFGIYMRDISRERYLVTRVEARDFMLLYTVYGRACEYDYYYFECSTSRDFLQIVFHFCEFNKQ
jgi:hypothetical protein